MTAAPSSDALRHLDSLQIGTLLDFAERNRVAPVLAHRILDTPLSDAELEERCHAIHETSARRMSVLMAEMDRLAAGLRAESTQIVALKNAGIARGIYPCAACCPMGDLDVLVDRSRFWTPIG